MTSVKDRVTKKCHSDPRVTVDTLHTNHISTLTESELNDYYLDNGVILDSYYGNVDSTVYSSQPNTTVNRILQYFPNTNCTDVDEPTQDESQQDESQQSQQSQQSQHIQHIQQYIENIDENTIDIDRLSIHMDKCPLCSGKMNIKYSKSDIICYLCGYSENIIIHSEKSSYKDPPREASYFAYKRINHFNEWLAQFQAKETTEIPENVYKSIYDEIKKNKTIDITKLTYKQVREILKKLHLNKYYEHTPHIINYLNGRQAPILKRYEEDTLRSLFKEIQLPFANNCPQERKNFLSYSYVLHKLCQLLEYDELLEFFPLLKSRVKLQQQDIIWKLICKDLQWEYIPSA